MKILIAYDGSQSSEAALDDLGRAGLPESGDAIVVTVAEVWLPPPEAAGDAAEGVTEAFVEEIVRKHREKGEGWLAAANMMAKHAQDRIKNILPGWNITSKATYGSPAWELLSAAQELEADLIVVGSHGRSAISRLVLGSISQKVLTEAECSVRVARGRIEVDPSAVRIIVGYDGSAGANAAVDSVAARVWPAETEVHLVSATDSIATTAIGRFIPPVADWAEEQLKSEYEWIAKLSENAEKKLKVANLNVTTRILEGDPNHILVREAENWHADCVFVGANAFGSRLERFLLGSTSSAVAARAHCSVEAVRRRKA